MELDNLKLLKEAVDKLYNITATEVEELRSLKKSLAQTRGVLQESLPVGKYIRDDNCIILSAPEIIIGDVDQYGICRGGGAVTLRSSTVSLEAMNAINNRAPHISSLAVNPGVDGDEDSVDGVSSITMQARDITIQSDLANQSGIFPDDLVSAPAGGIRLCAETGVEVAGPIGEARAEQLKSASENAKKISDAAKDAAKDAKQRVEDILKCFEEEKTSSILSSVPGMAALESALGINVKDYVETHDNRREFEDNLAELKSALDEYISNTLKYKTEACRKEGLDKYKYPIKDQKTFFSVTADGVFFSGTGEDDSLFGVESGNIEMSAAHKAGDKGNIMFFAENILLDAAKHEMKDKKETVTPKGNISVITKTLTVDAMTTEADDKETKNTALTAGSAFTMNIESVAVSTNDHENKGKGKISLTSKETLLQAQDFDKDGKPAQLTAEGKITATAQNLSIGGVNKDEKTMSKTLTVEADNISLNAKTSVAVAQNEKDLTIDIKEKALTLKGDKADVEVKNAGIKAETKIDGELEATKSLKVSKDVSASNVKAQSNVEATTVKASASVKTPIVSK